MFRPVRATIGIAAVSDLDFSSRVNSSPSIPGRPTSMRISEGLRLEIESRASSAEALPATSKPAVSSTVDASIRLAGSFPVPEHRQGGQGDDGNARRLLVPLQLARERKPIDPCQLHVHQDEVGRLRDEHVERFLRTAGHLNAESVSLEHRARQEAVCLVVVDDQDHRRPAHIAEGEESTTWRSRPSRSDAPVEPRLRIVDTCPLSWRMSASVRLLAVRTMIGVDFVASSARSASTTSKPVTSGIIRSSITRSGLRDLASSMASRPPRARMTAKPAGSRIRFSQSRLAASSSTTRMRGFSPALRPNLIRLKRLTSSLAGTGLTK